MKQTLVQKLTSKPAVVPEVKKEEVPEDKTQGLSALEMFKSLPVVSSNQTQTA